MLHEHADRLRATREFALVEVGFLNYSEPKFADAVRACSAAGVERVIIVPYFLVPGVFVAKDLPRALDSVRPEFRSLEFVLADPIGFDPRLADAILDLAESAAGPDRWREDLLRAPEFCTANPRCPLFRTPSCPATLGSTPVSASEGERLRSTLTEIQNPKSNIQNRSLLVVAHGSPDYSANAQMFEVIDLIRARKVYPIVEFGFLDCNEPDIPTAIDRCASLGTSRIEVVPYFLHTGRHVADDIPTLLEEGRVRHPDIDFRLARYLGSSNKITDILGDRAAEARK